MRKSIILCITLAVVVAIARADIEEDLARGEAYGSPMGTAGSRWQKIKDSVVSMMGRKPTTDEDIAAEAVAEKARAEADRLAHKSDYGTGAAARARDMAEDLYHSTAGAAMNAAGSAAEGMAGLPKVLKGAYDTAAGAASTAAHTVTDPIAYAASKASQGAAGLASSASHAAAKTAGAIKDTVTYPFTTHEVTAEDLEAHQRIAEQLEKATAMAEDLLEQARKEIASARLHAYGLRAKASLWQRAKSAVGGAVGGAYDTVTHIPQALKERIMGTSETVQHAGEKAAAGVSDTISGAASTVQETTSDMLKQAKQTAEYLRQHASDALAGKAAPEVPSSMHDEVDREGILEKAKHYFDKVRGSGKEDIAERVSGEAHQKIKAGKKAGEL